MVLSGRALLTKIIAIFRCQNANKDSKRAAINGLSGKYVVTDNSKEKPKVLNWNTMWRHILNGTQQLRHEPSQKVAKPRDDTWITAKFDKWQSTRCSVQWWKRNRWADDERSPVALTISRVGDMNDSAGMNVDSNRWTLTKKREIDWIKCQTHLSSQFITVSLMAVVKTAKDAQANNCYYVSIKHTRTALPLCYELLRAYNFSSVQCSISQNS